MQVSFQAFLKLLFYFWGAQGRREEQKAAKGDAGENYSTYKAYLYFLK